MAGWDSFFGLNPLLAGKSFQTMNTELLLVKLRLNPLLAGKSFQTNDFVVKIDLTLVLIPY